MINNHENKHIKSYSLERFSLMNKKFLNHLFFILGFVFLLNCDSSKSQFSNLDKRILCKNFAFCSDKKNYRFGIIGDSWTNLLFGTNSIETIREQLEKYHGYKLIGSTIGGQTLENALRLGFHYKTIDEAGSEIKYMLLSLGGNDLQRNPKEFVQNFQETKLKRLEKIQNYLIQMIQTGNLHKRNKYGGASLLWIIHGYDYLNPEIYTYENATSCRITLQKVGFTDEQIDKFTITTLDDYNELLKNLTFIEPSLRYIDLRGTLIKDKFANPEYMFDCIHPNSIGFSLITQKYVKILEGYTNSER